jgi:hypothetical protein
MEMTDRRARLHAMSEWLMEFSVLWAVFPLLDQLLSDKPLRSRVTIIGAAISFVTGVCGILLRKGEGT